MTRMDDDDAVWIGVEVESSKSDAPHSLGWNIESQPPLGTNPFPFSYGTNLLTFLPL